MSRKKVCILVFSEIARDGRVLREVEYARSKYKVDVIAYGPWSAPANVNYFQLTKSDSSSLSSNLLRLAYLAAGRVNPFYFEKAFWRQPEYKQALEILRNGQYDLIHANDWNSLPVASTVRTPKTRVLFDAHEYTPGQLTQHFIGRYLKNPYFEYMLRTYSKNIDEIITVSDGIASLYKSKFGWDTNIVRNAPRYVVVNDPIIDLTTVRLVHHGGASRKRYLENLIHLMPLLDKRFHLTFILVAHDKMYLSRLRELSNRLAPGRIEFREPVPPASLPKELAAYDIGIHLLPAVNLNHMYALPNKFFDFIMAGLGIVIYPLPEMKKIVNENQIGVVSAAATIQSVADALNCLTAEQLVQFRKNSMTLAKTLNGDVEMQKLMNIYSELLRT